MKRLNYLAGLATLALAASPALAQTGGQPPFEACRPGDFVVLGHPEEFGPKASPSFDVYIDQRFDGEFLTQQSIWMPSILGAIEKWNGIAGSRWRFNTIGVTSDEAAFLDNRLTIAACGGIFDCPEGPPPSPPSGPGGEVVDMFPQTTLAVTLIVEDNTAARRIADSDIFFNPAIPYEIDPGDGQIDFETVLLHELGHALGLDHNDNCGSERSIMQSFVDLNERKRELFSAEIEGVKFLYPTDDQPAVRVAVNDSAPKFSAAVGGFNPFEQVVRIHGNRGEQWVAESRSDFVTVSPTRGRFMATDEIEISVEIEGLEAGEYTGEVAVSVVGHPGPPALIRPTLVLKGTGGVNLPELTREGVVNGANLNSARVAPGSLITLFGENLAGDVEQAMEFPLPTNLAGTQVILNGVQAPLLYVSEGQINALVPYEVRPGRGGIIVRTGFGQTLWTPVEILPAAPELFVMDETQAIALDETGRLIASDNPARSGSVITVFFTGQGPVNPNVASVVAAPSDRPAEVISERSVVVAGAESDVLFMGLTPGFAGLAQANIQLPPTMSGDLPIQIVIEGQASNVAFVPVR